MTEYVYPPVPVEHLGAVYAALAAAMAPGATAPGAGLVDKVDKVSEDSPVRPSRKHYKHNVLVSQATISRARTAIKRFERSFSRRELAGALSVSISTAATLLRILVADGTVELTTDFKRAPGIRHGRGEKLYRALPPVKEAPNVKPADPPEVTGRGATGNGHEPVPGTGKQDRATGDVAKLINNIRHQGWTVKRTSGGHYQARKGQEVVVLPATPSDHRSLDNARASLRRAGANV
jgi:ribosomal protein S25/predicted RNA binding protein YcfA (HicA-like mRNA interferase family)